MFRFFFFLPCILAATASAFTYDEEFEIHQPQIKVMENQQAIAESVAEMLVAKIRERNRCHARTVLGLATGKTVIPIYEAFVRRVLEEKLDLSQVYTFNLDEYLGIPNDSEKSLYHFMNTHLFSSLKCSVKYPKGLREQQTFLPNGWAKSEDDLSPTEFRAFKKHFPKHLQGALFNEKEEMWVLKRRAAEYDRQIHRLGPIDIQILSLGVNGHIGLAEPGTPFNSRTHVVKLADSTRIENSRYYGESVEQFPEYAITMGIGTILQAKKIVLLAYGKEKADVVKQTLDHPLSRFFPATSLRLHPQVVLFIDQLAGEMLGK
ncbi:MAG: glucosamine-6-phosphate deaminase [Chlamydiales bacterium]|nr:glucosamine-6-phosphate deaminase [Chlamydiia bacterium]MCP5507478.1 glucosamine-6-phosphate deaminase [Chlamydiales bacterium]